MRNSSGAAARAIKTPPVRPMADSCWPSSFCSPMSPSTLTQRRESQANLAELDQGPGHSLSLSIVQPHQRCQAGSPGPAGQYRRLVRGARSTRRSPAMSKAGARTSARMVKKGDVLAEIDTPELDERLAQAREELGRAQAALALAKVTAERWAALRNSAAVSKQSSRRKGERRKGQAGRCRRGQRQSRPAQGAKGSSRRSSRPSTAW